MPDAPPNRYTGRGSSHAHPAFQHPGVTHEMAVAYLGYVRSCNADGSHPRPFDYVWRGLYRLALEDITTHTDSRDAPMGQGEGAALPPPQVAALSPQSYQGGGPQAGEAAAEEVAPPRLVEGATAPAAKEEGPRAPAAPPRRHHKDTVTVAQVAKGHRATKVFDESKTEDYDVGYFIRSRAIEITGLGELGDLVDALSRTTNRFILRGRCIADDERAPHTRLYRQREGRSPSYAMQDRRWVMLDIDELECPDDLDAQADPEAAVEWAKAQLPGAFAKAGCVYQWSASMGQAGWGKLKVHLWFWMDRAVCGPSLRAYFKRNPVVDCAPFNPVQPHYVASPVFEGSIDPIAERVGLIVGPDVAAPAQLLSWEDHQKVQERERGRSEEAWRASKRAHASSKGRGYAAAALEQAARNVLAAPVGRRHETIRDESLSTCRFVAAGKLSEAQWRAAFTEAGQVVLPKRRWPDIDRVLDGALDQEGIA